MNTKLLPQSVRNCLKRFVLKHSLMLSQAGQDYWVYGEAFNEKKCGYFLDIGAHDGMTFSNTYLLEAKYGWSGICVEANPLTFLKLEKTRKAKCLNICLDRCEGEVDFALRGVMGGIMGLDNEESDTIPEEVIKLRSTPLVKVLEDQHVPRVIYYMSIDVEGAEERVLGGFDFHKYTFRCFTIERPTELLRELFKTHDYILIKEIPGLDCFYVHSSFLNEYQKNLAEFYDKRHLLVRWR